MKRPLLATSALIDAATLSTGATVAAGMGLAYLQTPQPGERCRFTDLGDVHVVADLGAAAGVNLVALLAHNATGEATWRVRAAESTACLAAAVAGTDAATEIVEDSSFGSHYIQQAFAGLVAGRRYGLRLTGARGTGARDVTVQLTDGAADAISVNVDLTTGAVTESASGGTIDSSEAIDRADGNFTIEMKGRLTSAAPADVRVFIASGTTTGYAGDGSSSIFLSAGSLIDLETGTDHMADGDDFSGASWAGARLTSRTADAGAAPSYDSGEVSIWPSSGKPLGWADALHAIHLPATAESWRAWRVDVFDAANPDGYVQAGRLYVDAAAELRDWLEYGNLAGWIDPAGAARTGRGGQVVPYGVVGRHRVRALPLQYESEDDAASVSDELQRLRGLSKDVLYVADANADAQLQRGIVYGLFTKLSPYRNTGAGIFADTLQIEEMVP